MGVELNFLDAFLPFDLESAFIAAVSLILAVVVDKKLVSEARLWLKRAHLVFDELIGCGNLIAQAQKREVTELEHMFDELFMDPQHAIQRTADQMASSEADGYSSLPPLALEISGPGSYSTTQDFHSATSGLMSSMGPMLSDTTMGDHFTSEQIIDAANLVDANDAEWLSQAIMNYELW